MLFEIITVLLVVNVTCINVDSNRHLQRLYFNHSIRFFDRNVPDRRYIFRSFPLWNNRWAENDNIYGNKMTIQTACERKEENNRIYPNKTELRITSGEKINKSSIFPLNSMLLPDDRNFSHRRSQNILSKSMLNLVSNPRRARDVSEKDPCYFHGSCVKNNGFADVNHSFCFCDNDCLLYNDCCFDANRSNMSGTEPGMTQFMTCVKISMPFNTDSKLQLPNTGYHMVTKCPNNTTTKDASKCINYSKDDIPVTDFEGIVYRNINCAACHDVDKFKFWEISFSFDTCMHFDYSSITTLDINEKITILKRQGCRMNIVPPRDIAQFPRHCINNINDYENSDNEKCNAYANPIYLLFDGLYVRNYFCLNRTRPFLCSIPLETFAGRWIILPMTVLFQFKEQPGLEKGDCPGTDRNIKSFCFTSKCEDISSKHMCSTETVTDYVFKYNVSLESNGICSSGVFERAFLWYFLSLQVDQYNVKLESSNVTIKCTKNKNKCIAKSCFTALIGSTRTDSEIIEIRKNVSHLKFFYEEEVEHNSTPNLIQIQNTQLTDYIGCSNEGEDSFIIPYHIFKKFQKVLQFRHLNKTIRQIPTKVMVKVQVPSQEHDFNAFPSFVNVLYWNITYQNLTFIENTNFLYFVQTFITYVTMGTSSLVLILALSLFLASKMYTSLPDQICINIIFSSLLSYIFYMFGIGMLVNQSVCYCIGVALHFLWLSVFSWTSLYSYVVGTTLSELENNLSFDAQTAWSLKLLYVFSYGIPFIIVGTAVSLDVSVLSERGMQYSGETCFPTGYPGNVIFFTGPILLSIIFNIGYLLKTAKTLRKIGIKNSILNKSTENTISYFVVFVKLCLFSGIFWLFGVISQILKIEILAYIFIVACGLQGFVYGVCFLSASRIKQNCLKIIKKGNSKSSVIHQAREKVVTTTV